MRTATTRSNAPIRPPSGPVMKCWNDTLRQQQHDDEQSRGEVAGARDERHEPVDELRREDLAEGDERRDGGGGGEKQRAPPPEVQPRDEQHRGDERERGQRPDRLRERADRVLRPGRLVAQHDVPQAQPVEHEQHGPAEALHLQPALDLHPVAEADPARPGDQRRADGPRTARRRTRRGRGARAPGRRAPTTRSARSAAARPGRPWRRRQVPATRRPAARAAGRRRAALRP